MRHVRRSMLAAAVTGALIAAPALASTGDAAGAAGASGAAGQARHAAAVRHTVALTRLDSSSPIKHVVVIFQENHSFDNVLGLLCVQEHRCDGATTGKLLNGTTIPLTQAADDIPNVAHSTQAQQQAINDGGMDGFQRISGCAQVAGYRCYSQFHEDQIPNYWHLAEQYAISDRTFELDRILTFGAHVELASANLDGFAGNIPSRPKYAKQSGPGWGCESYKVTNWRARPSDSYQEVPPCIPYADGTGSWWDDYGPFGNPMKSPVQHITNIFDDLDAHGRSWKVYNAIKAFDICSYFATCVHSGQARNVVPSRSVITDAQNGTLPNVSFVLPDQNKIMGSADQHNGHSMAVGDNWIGDVVSSLQNGPEWGSTAVFITYDDCGCFYDHVPPPDGRTGIRLPMVIVSPWVKPGFTDSNNVGFIGMLTFTEHVFGLDAMSPDDASSYDYAQSFDFTQRPNLARTNMVTTHIPHAELVKVRKKVLDPDDPDDAT